MPLTHFFVFLNPCHSAWEARSQAWYVSTHRTQGSSFCSCQQDFILTLSNEVRVTSFPPLATPAMPCESNNQPLFINAALVIHCWCWLISRLFVSSLQVISKPMNKHQTCATNEVSPSSCARTSPLVLDVLSTPASLIAWLQLASASFERL